MSQQKIRRIVWTGAITAVTVTGAWYGASLKTRREIEQVCYITLSALPFLFLPLFPLSLLFPTLAASLQHRLTHTHPQVVQKIHEATPEEKIAQLEEIRATLVTKQ